MRGEGGLRKKERKNAVEVKKQNIFALKRIFITSLKNRNKSVFYGTLGRYVSGELMEVVALRSFQLYQLWLFTEEIFLKI